MYRSTARGVVAGHRELAVQREERYGREGQEDGGEIVGSKAGAVWPRSI
jgi:hypothetical protein